MFVTDQNLGKAWNFHLKLFWGIYGLRNPSPISLQIKGQQVEIVHQYKYLGTILNVNYLSLSLCVCVFVCVRACMCVCVHARVNYGLMLNNVQTRDNFLCMILAWTINNLILRSGFFHRLIILISFNFWSVVRVVSGD